MHLAVRNNSNTDILQYLGEKVDHVLLFERNVRGETPQSIAEERKWTDASKIINSLISSFDKTKKGADDLFSILDQEQAKAQREKQKRKEKKHQQKVKKIAAENNCSLDEAA